MNSKLLAIFAGLCAVLLAPASCEDIQQPDELYILNPGSIFPIMVTDPNSPLLDVENNQIVIVCNVRDCQDRCRRWGYRFGRCNSQAICVCSNY